MRIVQAAVAGTLESSDVMVRVSPAPPEQEREHVDVVVTSSVMAQYGDAITAVVHDTLDRLGLRAGQVVVEDKGALDCTLRARVQAACLRGSGSPDDIDWGAL